MQVQEVENYWLVYKQFTHPFKEVINITPGNANVVPRAFLSEKFAHTVSSILHHTCLIAAQGSTCASKLS